MAIDLLDSEPVMQALVHELELLAHRLGCGGIRTMVIGKDAPIATTIDHAPFYDPNAASGRVLSYLPGVASLLGLGAFKGRSTVPYASVAAFISDLASADAADGAAAKLADGRPWRAYVGRRVGFYSV